MNLIGIKARKASEYKVTTEVKNKVLNDYAKLIKNEKKFIINQNSKDINYAKKKGLKENLIKRLHLNENKLNGIINSILKNYKLAKGIIDKSDYIVEEDNDYKALMNVLTKEDDSALELKFYPIIPNVVNVL